jgi:CubicO group peptidase (beta-lactamase class C family)
LLALKAGASYESFIVSRICAPLDMKDTRIALPAGVQSRLASGHNAKGKPVSSWDFKTLEGCGAIRSSANDMLKFLAANMGVAPCPLSAAMARAQVPLRDADFGRKVALGWHLNPSGVVWHNGGTGGYRSFMGFDPQTKRGVVILCNSANEVDTLGVDALKQEKKHHPVPIDVQIYDRYVGDYKFAPKAILTVSRDGDRFFARLTGQQKIEFFPESETDFFCKVVDAQLTFLRGDTGPATHVILHQAGLDQKAPKVK